MASFVENGPGKAEFTGDRSRMTRRPAPNPHATAEEVEARLEGHEARPGALPRLGSGDLRRQVVDLVRRALHRLRPGPVRRRRGRSAAAVRARAGTRLRHRLLPAQPHAGRRRRRPARSPTSRPAWSRSRCATPSTSAATSTAASPTPSGSRTRTTPSTSSSATRCCTTSRTSSRRSREVLRVLKPGGRFVFAGEPTTHRQLLRPLARPRHLGGHHHVTKLPFLRRLASSAGRARRVLARRRARGRRRHPHLRPDRPESMAKSAGADEVRATTEEFAAALLGWPVRTFEAAVPPEKLGWGWAKFAFGGLQDAELGGREGAAARRPAQLLLQRDDHRREAGSDDVGAEDLVGYDFTTRGRRGTCGQSDGSRALAEVDRLGTVRRVRTWPTSAGCVRVSVTAPARSWRRCCCAARRRASSTSAAHWLFTDDALQQATPTVVARHRARRLAGRAVHDVTCSIGAELVGAGRCRERRDRQRPRPGAPGDGRAQRARRGLVLRADALRAGQPRHRRGRRPGAAGGRQAAARPGRAAAAAAGPARGVPRSRPRR